MSHRTALNKDLIMRRVAERHFSTSSTSLTTDPHESNAQVSALSDECVLPQTGQDRFATTIPIPTTRTAALSSIDMEIDAARQLTRSLLSRRNTLVPISALPPELLARIFYSHAYAEPVGFRGLGWIAVTHVCQRWRQVALDDSSLWARVSGFAGTKWIAETLVRARNAPLVIDLLGTPSPEIVAMFPQHIFHIRELRFRSLSLLHSQSVREICGSEAPELEDFELGLSNASPVAFDTIAGETLFKGQTPKLRTLRLAQIYIPWSLIPHGQLTRLEIIFYRWVPNVDLSPGDLNQLVDLLVNSPQLEVLAIDYCLPTALSRVSSGEPIRLPLLSRLCLGGPTSRVTNLLRRLTIPSSATLHLHCISETLPTQSDQLILPFITAHLHSSAPVEFKSLKVTANCLERLTEVVACVSPPKAAVCGPQLIETDMDNEASFSLSFDGLHCLQEIGPSNQADILNRVCEILPISNLEFLSIFAPDIIQFVDWYELFQRCTKITTIKATGRGTGSLLHALTPPKSTNMPSGSRGKKKKRKRNDRATQAQATGNTAGSSRTTTTIAPFPKLTSLLLENVNFCDDMPLSGILGDVMINTLRRRKECKTPVNTLTMDHCVITAHCAKDMREHVTDFCWDGDEGLAYSYDDWEDYEYASDFAETGARLEDFFTGTTQAEWEWFANYSDGY